MMLFETIKNNHFWNKYGLSTAWTFSLLLLLFSLAYTGWNGYQHYKTRKSDYISNTPIVTSQQASTPKFNSSDIVNAKLFGDPTPKKIVKQVAPQTTLNLKLQGILAASNPETARAIIVTGNGKGKLYSIGDDIEGANASIDSINASEVLLNRGGAIETLPLVRKTTSTNNGTVKLNSLQPIEPISNAYQSPAAPPQKSETFQFDATPKARAVNGQPRKIKKPNFSGLDQALKKLEN